MYSLTFDTQNRLKRKLAKKLRIKEERVEKAFNEITREEVLRIASNRSVEEEDRDGSCC